MSKKVIVLNDFLPEDIKADVMKDAPKLMHSAALQKAIDDHVTPGAYVELNGTFNLDKLEGYRPDIYGADGIKPSRDFPHITLNGSQPCLSIKSNDNEWNFAGAKFIVHRMFNDGIHVREFTGINVINLGSWYTKRILDIDPNNYAAVDRLCLVNDPSRWWIPPIDGTSGGGIKGTKEFGFNTTVNNFELSHFRSNAVDTSLMTKELAGFDPKYKDNIYPQGFPQDDGSYASTWGKWGGGCYGNAHAAICIANNPALPQSTRDAASFRVTGGYIRGFAYAGIEVGTAGTTDGKKIDNTYPNVEKYTVKNVKIENVIVEDVYESGIQRTRFDNLIVDNVTVRRAGHPGWSLGHYKPQTPGFTQVDPGYGCSSGRLNRQGKLIIQNSTFIDCNRKGIDAHHGSSTVIENNYIKAGYWGIQVALEEPQVDLADPTWEHQVCKYVIRDNEIHASYRGIDFANGSFGSVVRATARQWYMKLSVKVTDNVIHAPYGWYYNYSHDGFLLDGNTFIYSAPYGFPKAGGNEESKMHAVFHGTQDAITRGIGLGDVITNNRVMNSPYGNFSNGFLIQPTALLKFSGNFVDVTPFKKRIIESSTQPFISTKDSVFRDNQKTNPFLIQKPQIQPRFSDNYFIDRSDLTQPANMGKLDDASGGYGGETDVENSIMQVWESLKIIQETNAGVTSRASSDPNIFFANWENIRTEGKNPPKGFTSVVSGKNPLTISTYNGADRGSNVNNSATGVYADVVYPIRKDVHKDTVEFDVCIKALSKNKVGTVIGTDKTSLISIVNDNGNYYLRSVFKINVNGTTYAAKQDVAVTLNTTYRIKFTTDKLRDTDRLRLGSPQNGNNQITADFSEINIYRGMDDS